MGGREPTGPAAVTGSVSPPFFGPRPGFDDGGCRMPPARQPCRSEAMIGRSERRPGSISVLKNLAASPDSRDLTLTAILRPCQDSIELRGSEGGRSRGEAPGGGRRGHPRTDPPGPAASEPRCRPRPWAIPTPSASTTPSTSSWDAHPRRSAVTGAARTATPSSAAPGSWLTAGR